VRDLLGIGTCIGGLALPVWHVMPVFLDLKIAQDPSLPGLSTETLPITTTVTGWPCCLTGKFFFKQWASMAPIFCVYFRMFQLNK